MGGSFELTLLVLGLVVAGIGLVLFQSRDWFRRGRLPGDLRIESPNGRIMLLTTPCLMMRLLLSLASRLIRRPAG